MLITEETKKQARHQVYREQLAQYYCQHIQNFKGRKWDYIVNNRIRVGGIVGVGTGTGVTAGIIGSVSYHWVVLRTQENSHDIVYSALIGAAIGGALGCTVSVGLVYYEYAQWQKTEEGKLFAAQITAFLISDLVIKDLVCSLTKKIVLNPVRSPYGYIYDREAIEKWVHKHATDPIAKQPLKLEELSPARDIYTKVAKKMAKILEEDVYSLKDIDPRFINGLNALREDIEQQRDEEFNKEISDLQFQKRKGTLTVKLFNEKVKELNKFYYFEED